MTIPTLKWDSDKQVSAGPLTKLPYMCGTDRAYRIMDAKLAISISPADYMALPADSQNGAYDLTDSVPVDMYDPLSGRYSLSY
jgi:hypothetical protein